MTDVAINHIYVVIKIFLENYLQELPVLLCVCQHKQNKQCTDRKPHAQIDYVYNILTNCTCTCQQQKQEQWFYRKSLLHVLLDSL